MVDPISAAERSSFNRRAKVAVTLLVGVSAGLISLQVETTAIQTAGSIGAGLVVGWALAWFVVPTGAAPADDRERVARDNPFADGGNDESGDDGRRR